LRVAAFLFENDPVFGTFPSFIIDFRFAHYTVATRVDATDVDNTGENHSNDVAKESKVHRNEDDGNDRSGDDKGKPVPLPRTR
jgi:hypothetical protein